MTEWHGKPLKWTYNKMNLLWRQCEHEIAKASLKLESGWEKVLLNMKRGLFVYCLPPQICTHLLIKPWTVAIYFAAHTNLFHAQNVSHWNQNVHSTVSGVVEILTVFILIRNGITMGGRRRKIIIKNILCDKIMSYIWFMLQMLSPSSIPIISNITVL